MTTAFSRSGRSSKHGKCTEELKTKVPEDVKTDFALVARVSDTPLPAEYLRDLITDHLYGSVPADMKDIVWEHVEKETQTPLLRKLLRVAIYGQLHETSLGIAADTVQGMNGVQIGALHED
jgi:hypothetical protein